MVITEDYKAEMLADTKLLLGINDNSSDEILTYIIDDVVNMVLSYCRLEILPYQLQGLIPQMAVSVYNTRQNIAGVSAITEGDRKIEYRSAAKVISDYYSRLKPFVNCRAKLPSEVQSDEK